MRDTVKQALEWANPEEVIFSVNIHPRRENEVIVVSFDNTLRIPTIPGIVLSGQYHYEGSKPGTALWKVYVFRKREEECTTTK